LTYQKGWWVRLTNGLAGVIVEWPEKGRGFTMETTPGPNGNRIAAYKTAISCRENPNTFCDIPTRRHHERERVKNIDGRDDNYAGRRGDDS
jgi:hypothetical protein